MNKAAESYFVKLREVMDFIRVTNREGQSLNFYRGIEETCKMLLRLVRFNRKLMFIGNGASAAISSHMAADFLKNGGIESMAFNDGPLITCMGNDYGYQHVFEKPIELMAHKGDILFAISSSGKSENILLAATAARLKKCNVVTLSGFESNNPLSILGDINFYVPSQEYGPVEIIHHAICHCILDTIISHKRRSS